MDERRKEGCFPDRNLGAHHSPPYKMGKMFLFLGKRWAGREVDHSIPLCSKIDNKWSPTFVTLCLRGIMCFGVLCDSAVFAQRT